MVELSVREIQHSDIEPLSDYWFKSDPEFLVAMGVDLSKMPTRDEWKQMLTEQISQSYEEKRSYCIIWLVNDEPIGHSKDISFGGMFIDLKNPLILEKMIYIEFKLPDQSYIMKALVKVKWNKANLNSKQIAGVGVEFINVSSVEETRLRSYLEDILSKYVKLYSKSKTISR